MKKMIKLPKKILLAALVIAAVSCMSLSFGLNSQTSYAQGSPSTTEAAPADPYCKEGQKSNARDTETGEFINPCVEADAKMIAENAKKLEEAKKETKCANDTDCGNIVNRILNPLITLMTGIAGIVIAISLVVGGITYSAAGGDPSKVAAAKSRIVNTIIALVGYIFAFGLMQWLVPGGIV